jgi:hypothetical protein
MHHNVYFPLHHEYRIFEIASNPEGGGISEVKNLVLIYILKIYNKKKSEILSSHSILRFISWSSVCLPHLALTSENFTLNHLETLFFGEEKTPEHKNKVTLRTSFRTRETLTRQLPCFHCLEVMTLWVSSTLSYYIGMSSLEVLTTGVYYMGNNKIKTEI